MRGVAWSLRDEGKAGVLLGEALPRGARPGDVLEAADLAAVRELARRGIRRVMDVEQVGHPLGELLHLPLPGERGVAVPAQAGLVALLQARDERSAEQHDVGDRRVEALRT